MAKLKVTRVSIRNILGVEELEFEPGKITVISGANGTGKTSVLEGLRSVVRGGHDATLVRQGAIEGEVVFVLEDGTEIDKRINEKSSSVTVRKPEVGKIAKPQTYIDSLINTLSINPIDLLTAPEKQQKELFLKAMPIQVSIEQLREASGLEITEADVRHYHALDAVDYARKLVFDSRTDSNRSLREKQATVKSLSESLPEDPPEGDWLKRHNTLAGELAAHEQETDQGIEDLQTVRDTELRNIDNRTMAEMQRLREVADRAIAAIKEQLSTDIQTCQENRHNAHSAVIDEANDKIYDYTQSRLPERDRLLSDKQHARTMADQSIRAESAKSLLATMLEDVAGLTRHSSALTSALSRLDRLAESLMQGLPIEGLEVRDGQLYLHNIHLSRWNESVRIQLAMDLAKLSAGELGLIVVDGLERLDQDSFKAFLEYVNADDSGVQYVVSRVTEAPTLQISAS